MLQHDTEAKKKEFLVQLGLLQQGCDSSLEDMLVVSGFYTGFDPTRHFHAGSSRSPKANAASPGKMELKIFFQFMPLFLFNLLNAPAKVLLSGEYSSGLRNIVPEEVKDGEDYSMIEYEGSMTRLKAAMVAEGDDPAHMHDERKRLKSYF